MSARRAQVPSPLPVGLPPLVGALAERLRALPGVGEKASQRLAIWLAMARPDVAQGIGTVLSGLHAGIGCCSRCLGLAERHDGNHVCAICRDAKRDATLLCVVARVQDLLAVERSGAMRGTYFVLGGLVSPLEGTTADSLPMGLLRQRVADGVREVLLALPASTEGNATALVVGHMLSGTGAKVSAIAHGVAHGSDLEYADPITLNEAIRGRKAVT